VADVNCPLAKSIDGQAQRKRNPTPFPRTGFGVPRKIASRFQQPALQSRPLSIFHFQPEQKRHRIHPISEFTACPLFAQRPFPLTFPTQSMQPSLRHLHFIGICGTAMGAVAAALRDQGFIVTGSDAGVYPPMSTFLEERGIPIASPSSRKTFPPKQTSSSSATRSPGQSRTRSRAQSAAALYAPCPKRCGNFSLAAATTLWSPAHTAKPQRPRC
jgi:hypothetical protein